MSDTAIDAATSNATGRSRTSAPSLDALERMIARWQEQPLTDLLRLAQAHDISAPRDLVTLALTDQERRWRQGRGIAAEEYLRLFPSLCSDVESAGDLIYSEYILREELGDCPAPAEFAQRFPDFRDLMEGQLAFHRALEEPARCPPGAHQPAGSPRLPRLGNDYEILSEIGRGGMGIVYQARQVGLNRLVALKVLRAGQWCSAEQLARFRAEAATVARLHHSHIVQIYDYGEHDGLPYLALELVAGGTLAERLAGNAWATRPAAKLIQTLARAVQFAHERGVIHRDLKPANILVGSQMNVADARLEADPGLLDQETSSLEFKIADFGLAKTFHDSDLSQTQSGTILGTPSYMAPEQARGLAREVGPATDIYALGALLYHLLSGRPPFQAASAAETLQQVLTQDPVSIDRLQPGLPSDLATICSRCLDKEPGRRYRTAADLADDLDRFITDRPIRARPVGMLERGWRWCRRNRMLAAMGSTLLLVLLSVAIGSTVFSAALKNALRKRRDAHSAEILARHDAQQHLWDAYLTEINARQQNSQVGQRFAALETLDKANALLDQIGSSSVRLSQLRNAAIASLARPDLRPAGEIADLGSDDHVVVSAKADRYLIREPEGHFALHELSTGKRLLRFSQLGKDSVAILSPDARYMAGSTDQGTIIWRIDGVEAVVVRERTPLAHLSFAASGDLAAASDAHGQMQLLDLASGTMRQLGRGPADSLFSFHLPSRRVAVCGSNSLQIIAYETGQILTELPKPTSVVSGVAWHPEGKYLAAGCYGDQVVLWDIENKTRAQSFAHASSAMFVSFSASGDSLVTFSPWDGQERLWDTASGHLQLDLPTFGAEAHSHTSAGNLLLVRRQGPRVELWEFEPSPVCRSLATGLFPSHGEMINTVNAALDPQGQMLAVGRDTGLELWDTQTGKRCCYLPAGRHGVAFDAAGNLFTGSSAGVFRWPRRHSPASESQSARLEFGPPEALSGGVQPASLTVSPSGKVLAGDLRDVGWEVVQLNSESNVAPLGPLGDARNGSISRDERYLAVACWDQPLTKIFRTSGEHLTDLRTGVCGAALFSPDARWLATSPNGVQLWRVEDWQFAHSLQALGNTPGGLGLAFSPDSQVLAVGQPDGITRLVDPANGEEYATLTHLDRGCTSLMAFRSDQTQLVTLGRRRTDRILVWDLPAIRKELAARGLDWPEQVLKASAQAGADLQVEEPLEVTLNDAHLFNREQARQLAWEARKASPAEAVALLERAVVLDPHYAFIHNQLAWFLATGPDEIRRPVDAVQHAKQATASPDALPEYYNTLGVAFLRSGCYEDSIVALLHSQQLEPSAWASIYDHLFLGLAEAQRGNRTEAERWLSQAVRGFENEQSTLTPTQRTELLRFFQESRGLGLPFPSEP